MTHSRGTAGSLLRVIGVAVSGGAVAVSLVAGPAAPAAADPGVPSAEDVRRARRSVSGAAADVGRIQAELAAASARADQADVDLGMAAEDYDTARIELEESRKAAALANAAARSAGRRLGGARREVGRLAAAAYRDGGDVASLGVVLGPRGPQDALERASMMHVLGQNRTRALHRMDAARVVATVLDRQADEALGTQRKAAAALGAARAAAERHAAEARATVAETGAMQDTLLTRLAAARKTSLTVERARQAGLLAEGEARAERARVRQSRREAQSDDRKAPTAPQRHRDRAGARSVDGPGANPAPAPAPAPAPPPAPAPAPAPDSGGSATAGQRAVAWARTRVGLPYRWGGAGPNSYDCSGLTMRAWQRAGLALPHSSRLQYRTVTKVSYAALRPGDLVFYGSNPADPSSIHHVTMYAGGGMMVEAPATGLTVRVVPLRRNRSMPFAGRP